MSTAAIFWGLINPSTKRCLLGTPRHRLRMSDISCEQSNLSWLFRLNNFYRAEEETVEDFTRIKENKFCI